MSSQTRDVSLPAPEFSRIVPLDLVETGAQSREIAADAGERAALAGRFGVENVRSLEAELTAAPRKNGVRVTGRVRATLDRTCVATLGPVVETIDEAVDIVFMRGAGEAAPGEEIEIDADAPEPLEGDEIDLGEIAAQQAALAMDPYPRAEGVGPRDHYDQRPDPETDRPSPFAKLKALKRDA